MSRCILHVGMPKTGTSSIQETLFFAPNNPHYQYFSGGEISAARLLKTVCTEGPLPMHFFGALGQKPSFIASRRRRYTRMLERSLRRSSNRGIDLVLSGESCWAMPESELQCLKTLLQRFRFQIQVVAYIRPWRNWLESNYQQQCKYSCLFRPSPDNAGILSVNPAAIDYRQRIETLDHVFGRENVLVRKFDPRCFPEGCVVRDFCQQLCISIPHECIRKANEAIRLDALRFLVAYGKFGNREGRSGVCLIWQHSLLIKTLRQLSGPPVRLHSSLVEPIIAPLKTQLDWLEKRIGTSMTEDLQTIDQGECISCEADLFRFSHESLQWLTARTGSSLPSVSQGEETARQVGILVHRLRHSFPETTILAKSATAWATRHLTAWTKGR